MQSTRPHWVGATSVSNYTSPSTSMLVCICVQGSHWCPRSPTQSCGVVCRASGRPYPLNYCVSSSTPLPPQPLVYPLPTPTGEMTALLIPPVRRFEPRAPVSISRSPSGSYVLDFQVNQAMQCTLRIDTDGTLAGTTLRLHHAEQVTADGSIVYSNDLGGAQDQTTFILGGTAGVQEFDTTFAYFGARFVDIQGWPQDSEPTTDSMTCYFVHTALPQWSSIRFGSPQGSDTATILNGLHDIIVRSALSNFMSVPTDCPSREKRGWTGDGQAAAETLVYSFDMSSVYPKWLGDITDAQQCNFNAVRSCPAGSPWCRSDGDGANIPEIAPFEFGGSPGQCSGLSDPAWGSGFIAVLDWVHTYYADQQVLAQQYANGAAYLESLLPYVDTGNGSSLLDMTFPGTHYGDWCAVVRSGNQPLAPATPRHTSNLISGFYWLKQVRIMAAAAQTLGIAADAKKWATIAERGAASYTQLYFNATGGVFQDIECSRHGGAPAWCHNVSRDNDMSVQTAQALPLYLGLPASPTGRKQVGDALARDVLHGAYPGRTTTGLVGSKYVLSELVATGHADVAMTVATAMEFPSWGRMLPSTVHPLGQGEGTLWEQFGGNKHTGFGSRNHIMLGGFDGPFFFGNLAGIQNAGSAWDRITIAPTVAGDLSGVAATVGTVRGSITVEWSAGTPICAVGVEQDGVCLEPAVVNCTGNGGRIDKILFASYGVQSGTCPGNWSSACTAKSSMEVVRAACIGKASCIVNATNAVFGGADPCPGQPKRLAIQAVCAGVFTIATTIPAGTIASVRIPLLGNSTAATTTIEESGNVVWRQGKFNPTAAVGVTAAAAEQTLAGPVIAFQVGSGRYSFTLIGDTP